jgi:hypothetical protein
MELKTNVSEQKYMKFVTSAIESWSKSFWNLTLPSDLLQRSEVKNVTDVSGYLIRSLLYYGERNGSKAGLPYDGGEMNDMTDLSSESLWVYNSTESKKIPTGFDSVRHSSFYIGTGKTHKCPTCRGKGIVKCTTCRGSGRYRATDWNGNRYWKDCSCGSGYNDCDTCTGYGLIETSLRCTTQYKTRSRYVLDYQGPNFVSDSSNDTKRLIRNSNGKVIIEEIVEFPFGKLQTLLKGGISTSEFSQIRNEVRDNAQQKIRLKLTDYSGNVDLVEDAISRFFANMPSPSSKNTLLEYEMIPVRMRISVESRPIFQVQYEFEGTPHTLWVHGKTGSVFASERPKEFTKKAKILLAVVAVVSTLGIILMVVNS